MFKIQQRKVSASGKSVAWKDFDEDSYNQRFLSESDAWAYVARFDEDGIPDKANFRVVER